MGNVYNRYTGSRWWGIRRREGRAARNDTLSSNTAIAGNDDRSGHKTDRKIEAKVSDGKGNGKGEEEEGGRERWAQWAGNTADSQTKMYCALLPDGPNTTRAICEMHLVGRRGDNWQTRFADGLNHSQVNWSEEAKAEWEVNFKGEPREIGKLATKETSPKAAHRRKTYGYRATRKQRRQKRRKKGNRRRVKKNKTMTCRPLMKTRTIIYVKEDKNPDAKKEKAKEEKAT